MSVHMILLNLPSSAACGHRGYATSWRCWVWSFCAPCKFATLAVWLRQETEICTWSCFHPVFLWCFENPTPSGVQEFKIYYLCCLGTDHRPAASTLWRILSLSFFYPFWSVLVVFLGQDNCAFQDVWGAMVAIWQSTQIRSLFMCLSWKLQSSVW